MEETLGRAWRCLFLPHAL